MQPVKSRLNRLRNLPVDIRNSELIAFGCTTEDFIAVLFLELKKNCDIRDNSTICSHQYGSSVEGLPRLVESLIGAEDKLYLLYQ